MKKLLECMALLALATATAVAQTAPPPPPLYGNGWQAFSEGLENLRVGYDASELSIRFIAEQNDKLKSVTLFLKGDPGYSAGTGGTVNVALESDDGTANHFPSGTVLDSSSCTCGASSSDHQFNFSGTVALTAGKTYHLVITNTDSSPTSNYISVNNMYNSAGANPYYSFNAWAMLWNQNGPLTLKTNTTPICAIKYSGGASQGMGYDDSLSQSQLINIEGSTTAAESFTVQGGSRIVSSVNFHIRRVGSPGPLTVTLSSGSSTIEQGAIPTSAVTSGSVYAYATYTFTKQITLTSGTSYLIQLSAPADPSNYYQTHPMRKGIQDGFDVPSVFHDGFYVANGSSMTNEDMKMYFTTVSSGTTAQAPNPPTGLSAVVQ